MEYSNTFFKIFLLTVTGMLLAKSGWSDDSCERLFAKAQSFEEKALYDSTVIAFQEAAECYKTSGNWEQFTTCHQAVSYFLYLQEKENLMVVSLESAVNDLKNAPDASPDLVFDLYNNLGSAYQTVGKFDQAISLFRLVLEKEENNPDADFWILVDLYNNMGIAYGKKLDYYAAESYFQKALLILEKHGPGYFYDIADIRNNLGQALRRSGRTEAAIKVFDQCLSDLNAYKPGSDDDVFMKTRLKAAIKTNLGMAFVEKGDFQQALDFVDEAEKLEAPLKINPYLHYLNRGYFLTEKGDFENAIKELDKAEAYAREQFGQQKAFIRGKIFLSRGDAYREVGKHKQALEDYQKAISQFVPDFEPDNSYKNPNLTGVYDLEPLQTCLQNKGLSLLALSKNQNDPLLTENALETFDLSTRLIDEIRLDHVDRISTFDWLEKSRKAYEGAIEAAFRLNRPELVFNYMESSKAVSLLSAWKFHIAGLNRELPAKSLENEKQLRLEIRYLRQKLLSAKRNGNSEASEKIKEQIFDSGQQLEKEIEFLKIQFPEYFAYEGKNRNIDLTSVRQFLLNDHQVMIEYFWGEADIYCVFISRESISMRKLSNDDQLRRTMDDFLSASRIASTSEASFTDFCKSSNTLYQTLLGNEVGSIPVDNILIVPDGKLSFLPFGAFIKYPFSGTFEEARFDTLSYFGTEVNYSLAYSASVLQKSRQKLRRPAASRNFGGFAPVFRGNLAIERQGLKLDSLLHTRKEITAIHDIVKGEVFLEEDANTANLFNNADKFRILHLATHANVSGDPERPGCRIHLADSSLVDYQILNLPLEARLTVLSACETGTGHWLPGEGVMSLARAFNYAGCPSLVASLWKANDASTADLMIRFYKNLDKGQRQGTALASAKREYLEKITAYEKAHPFYWAGFVHIGLSDPVFSSNRSGILWWLLFAVALIIFIARVRKG